MPSQESGTLLAVERLIGEEGEGAIPKYTRFERARIIGARALQIAMGAPILIKTPSEQVDPVDLSELEFEKGVIPITVRRGM